MYVAEMKSRFSAALQGEAWLVFLFLMRGSERKQTLINTHLHVWEYSGDNRAQTSLFGAPLCLCCNCRTPLANAIIKTCGSECEYVYM